MIEYFTAWIYFMAMIVSWESKFIFAVPKTLLLTRSFQHYWKKKLIVWKSNKDVCHSEVDSTFNFIRSNFWIIRGQKIEEKLLKSCFICKILHGKNNDISLYSSITNICSILQLYLWNRRSRFYRPIVM